MASYQIDYSDPLQVSFNIPAGGLNGPGASASNSTLRLYGRGALEWGEAVDENQLRLTENFASASPPSSAISGQIWVQTNFYYHNSGAATAAGWYRWNVAGKFWDLLNGSGNVATTKPSVPSIGQYYYGTDDYDGLTITGLWGYYSLGRYEPAAWIPRTYTNTSGAPSGTDIPLQYVRVRNTNNPLGGSSGTWQPVDTAIVSNIDPNASGQFGLTVGQIWFNPDSGIANMFTSDPFNRWQNLLGPGGGIANGQIDMNGNRITGINVTPLLAGEATSKQYVDSLFGGIGGTYLPIAGGTITGNLGVNGTTNLNNLAVSGTITMNGNRVQHIATPTAADDATTKSYVDTAVAGSSGSGVYLPLSGGTITGNLGVNGTLNVGGTVTLSGTTNTSGSIVLSGGSSQITLPNAPTSGTQAANKAYVDAVVASNAGSPTGTVVMFAGSIVPAGWLACEGQTLNNVTYAALFTAIGYIYGGGGSNFSAPDLRGQFVRGWSNGGPVDPGRVVGSSQLSSIESHKHVHAGENVEPPSSNWPFGNSTTKNHPGTKGGWDFDNYFFFTNDGTDYPVGGVPSGAANWNRAGLIGTETRPTNVAMRYIIKT